jgi:ATP sulfurylase
MDKLVKPHGGQLVQRWATDLASTNDILARSQTLPTVTLDQTAVADLELLGNGALSPLTGFMGQQDYKAVLEGMRLADGLVWTIPIVLGTDSNTARDFSLDQQIALRQPDGKLIALMQLEEIYPHDPAEHARAVFGTDQGHHPGVARVLRLGDLRLGGAVTVLPSAPPGAFDDYWLSPRQVRAEFSRRGWKTVVAFQTRNPIHRAHEYLMKCALESTDGLLLHPIVGHTKADDLPADIRLKSYEILLDRYFNPDCVMMSVLPAAMRYAGPREAVFHAIIRKNYGCTHFIVGRDHAGAQKPDGTSFYGTFEAHEIFNRFAPNEIGIDLFFYDHAFYCRQCEAIVSAKTAPPEPELRFQLSGTKVRELLRAGIRPPPEITRPEVADVLIQALKDKQREAEAARGGGI